MERPLTRRALVFRAPGQVELRDEPAPAPGPGEVRVATRVSAVSAGTELLIYRGQAPEALAADAALSSLPGTLAFPLKYGYACVGRVEALGPGVDPAWDGRPVFAFNPHETRFTAAVDALLALPEELDPARAALLPNLETAVNLLHDGRPLAGERVVVVGQGMVGLLTTALLARFPLADLITLDPLPARRALSRALGAGQALDPGAAGDLARLHTGLDGGGADLVYELSGDPAALDLALSAAGFAARVVIGSWYGRKRAAPDLGGAFHRSRVRLLSSQVSTIDPALSGRWDKPRRLGWALRSLQQLDLSPLPLEIVPLSQAPEAYRRLDRQPNEHLQVIFDHDE